MDGSDSGIRKRFGKYRLVGRLAVGGMAEIFLARQVSFGGFEKLVVIKHILPHLAREEKFVRMFLDEARIAALLHHPNVVQIFDLGRIEDQYYIAMEYLPGESLSVLLGACRNRRIKLPGYLAASIVMQAAAGLHHAHTMTGKDGSPLNIVHRDVSPHNIIVQYDGSVKLVDFGVAKAALSSTQTQAGALKGKFAYMSPEQVLGTGLDGRADVFALGIVLWECLTGRRLFTALNHLDLMESIVRCEIEPPSTFDPEISGELEAITLRALQRDREERFSTADELHVHLADYLTTDSKGTCRSEISELMHRLFAERIEQKRGLVDGAEEVLEHVGEFDIWDLSGQLRVAEDSFDDIRHATLHTLKLSGDSDAKPVRRSWITAAVALLVLLILLIVGGNLISGPNAEADKAVAQQAASASPGASVSPGPVSTTVSPRAEEPAADPAATTGPGQNRASDKPVYSTRKERGSTARRRPRKHVARRLKPGLLRLKTNPWAEIYHSGHRLGQTPLVDVSLPAGEVKLRAVNKQEGIDRIITVRIQSGKRVNKFVDFKQDGASIPLP